MDVDLQVGDVRLTMGGEPTFVSLDDRNGSEWTTTAMSPAKRKLAVELLYRMRDRFSSGALLHFGQGKWYPGEELPRWALGVLLAQGWRSHLGEPKPLSPRTAKITATAHPKHSKFLEALTLRLQVSSAFTITAYEDIFFHLWKERRLPEIVDPLDPKLKEFPSA